MSISSDLDQKLEAIAKKWFDVETLETRGMDGLDFYDVSVGCIKKALHEAFSVGLEIGVRASINHFDPHSQKLNQTV